MQPYSEGTFDDVAQYKFEQAKDDFEAAKLLLEAEKYKAANNRAYYACFHAIDAVLAKEPAAFKKHKDTISYFNKNYVHTEIFPSDIGRNIRAGCAVFEWRKAFIIKIIAFFVL